MVYILTVIKTAFPPINVTALLFILMVVQAIPALLFLQRATLALKELSSPNLLVNANQLVRSVLMPKALSQSPTLGSNLVTLPIHLISVVALHPFLA